VEAAFRSSSAGSSRVAESAVLLTGGGQSGHRRITRSPHQRPFRKREGSRATLFAQLDRPALHPLPATRYEFGEWKKVRVNIDYHVEVERHYYSVPYSLWIRKWKCT